MINYPLLKPYILSTVGFRQNPNPNGPQLDNELLQSTSGLYYEGGHTMVTLDNLFSIAPEYDRFTFPEWNTSSTYSPGQVVLRNGNRYRALITNTNQDPQDGGSYDASYGDSYDGAQYWERFMGFSTWLKDEAVNCGFNVITNMLKEKSTEFTARNLLEDKHLFQGVGRLTDYSQNLGKTVGYAIEPIYSKGIAVKVLRIGLQFTVNQTITIRLFHSSQKTPINSVELAYTGSGNMQWFSLTDFILPYFSTSQDAGGVSFITYSQTQITGSAINRGKDFNNFCYACNSGEYLDFQAYSKYIKVMPFYVQQDSLGNMFDPYEVVHTPSDNYGINLQVTAYCDYTQFVIDHINEYATLFQKAFAIEMLKALVYNPNSLINRNQANAQQKRQELIYEVDGDTRGRKTGLNYEYQLALKASKISMEGISKVCLPCDNTRRVRVRVM